MALTKQWNSARGEIFELWPVDGPNFQDIMVLGGFSNGDTPLQSRPRSLE